MRSDLQADVKLALSSEYLALQNMTARSGIGDRKQGGKLLSNVKNQ